MSCIERLIIFKFKIFMIYSSEILIVCLTLGKQMCMQAVILVRVSVRLLHFRSDS